MARICVSGEKREETVHGIVRTKKYKKPLEIATSAFSKIWLHGRILI